MRPVSRREFLAGAAAGGTLLGLGAAGALAQSDKFDLVSKVGEMLNIDYADVDQAAKTLAENPELVLGVKVRETVEVVGTNGLEPLKRAILACERSGVRGARVMCHIGNAPGELSALLDQLRPGDILTHAYSGAGNNTVRDGKV